MAIRQALLMPLGGMFHEIYTKSLSVILGWIKLPA